MVGVKGGCSMRRFVRMVIPPAILLFVVAGCAIPASERAFFSLQQQVNRDPGNLQARNQLVIWYLNQYDNTRVESFRGAAVTHLKEMIRRAPDEHYFHCTLAKIYCDQQKYDLALFEGREAVRLGSDCPVSHMTLAEAYASLEYSDETCYDDEQAEQGVREAQEAVRLAPENARARELLSHFYAVQGLHELSLFEAREMVLLDNKPATHYQLAWALLRNGQFGEAASEFKTASGMPKGPDCRMEMARVYLYANRFADAVRETTEVQRDHPNRMGFSAVITKYLAMRQMGDDEAAGRFLSDSAGTAKSEQKPYRDIASYYAGKTSEADLLKTARHRCDRAIISYYLGYDYLLKGQKEKAREHFQETVRAKAHGFAIDAGARAMLEQLGR